MFFSEQFNADNKNVYYTSNGAIYSPIESYLLMLVLPYIISYRLVKSSSKKWMNSFNIDWQYIFISLIWGTEES